MFDPKSAKNLGKSDENPEKNDEKLVKPSPYDWKSFNSDELIQLRDQITQHLPPIALKDMNLEEEMLLQYHALRALQNSVLTDVELPLNQRAQVANAVANNLDKLAQLQETLYSTERYKRVENIMIRTLNKLPEAEAEYFLTEYEKMLDAVLPKL